ncbi:alpha 1,2-mannosyltransferase 2.4.1 [Coemansia sp. RSA 1358]|uniref:Alpha 1,2-mannosyltransferase 2.4.1 n=2 Tax=Coemansia TaxID=4863 RepID=A0ABQ8PPB1_9FUNG|nr:alpha 1,2-mannosyltransferase 2.4.1 [Coemansia umbellata]KAJ2622503.1 alpha 1,2-mannosyltransferase 2.4.1 [Coemansia sp. RSA 1358]
METRRDLRGILFVLVVFVGLAVIWRDLRYDFNFASDMHKAELGRRRETITQTVTSIALQTQIETQTELTTEIVKLSEDVSPAEKASAAFVILTRNKDLKGLRETLAQLEDRFNRRYHYPYVFLNNEPFSDDFKERVRNVVSGECHFGLIPTEHWSYPDYINQTRAAEARKDMAERKVIYGGNESYRHMCRYESGFFFRHPLMNQFKWYWRVEPDVKFACDIDYDPFLFMEKNNKKYGFTVSIKEVVETIPTLWNTTMDFMKEYRHLIPEKNLMEFVTDDKGGYNRCHFWSNFEIGSLDFLRSEQYMSYFDYLDRAGGFFYERWGDAPVHSLGVTMFLNKNEVHWFEDIGYYHGPLWNCPKGELNKNKKCWCLEEDSIETKNKGWSCTLNFVALPNP